MITTKNDLNEDQEEPEPEKRSLKEKITTWWKNSTTKNKIITISFVVVEALGIGLLLYCLIEALIIAISF